jgi:hypothetical protein
MLDKILFVYVPNKQVIITFLMDQHVLFLSRSSFKGTRGKIVIQHHLA